MYGHMNLKECLGIGEIQSLAVTRTSWAITDRD